MRKTLYTLLAGSALLVAAPAVGLAKDGRHDNDRDHHGVQHERLGDNRNVNHRFEFETRGGSVSSFSHGVLTIKLGNGRLVSGQVKPTTRIECFSSASSTIVANERGDRGDQGDDRGNNRGNDNGDQGDDRGNNRRSDNGDRGDDRGDDRGLEHVNCPTTALKPGHAIHEAERKRSVWTEVELIVGARQHS